MDTTEKRPKKEKKGIELVWSKLKAIFTTKYIATRLTSSATTTKSVPVASVPHTTEEAPIAPKQEYSLDPSPALEIDTTGISTLEIESFRTPPDPNITGRGPQAEAQMRTNRFEAIFAKYNLELDETEWDRRPKVPHERVHKNIRIRVKHTCHNCSTTFGRDRLCAECQHRRCTRCSRYPPKRDRPKASQDVQEVQDSSLPQPQSDAPRQSAEGGTCHECQTGFEIEVEECPNCHHKICDRCIHEASVLIEPSHGAPSQPTQVTTPEKDPEHQTTTQEEPTAVS